MPDLHAGADGALGRGTTTNSSAPVAADMTAALNVQLQTATNLVPPINWTAATNVPVLTGNQMTVTISPTGTLRFFRLTLVP